MFFMSSCLKNMSSCPKCKYRLKSVICGRLLRTIGLSSTDANDITDEDLENVLPQMPQIITDF